jgi:hypothetical protein
MKSNKIEIFKIFEDIDKYRDIKMWRMWKFRSGFQIGNRVDLSTARFKSTLDMSDQILDLLRKK